MPQSVVVIGDIGVSGLKAGAPGEGSGDGNGSGDGPAMIHIGDEAMFEAAIDALRSRGISHITGISAEPAESAGRYGIEAVAQIGWPASRAEREQRLALVASAAAGDAELPAGDPARDVIEAVRAAGGALIAGGGNMSTLWPHHIFERAALGRIAAAVGTPLVVSGQTIGPELDAADTALVRELLSTAAFVGLREPISFALCEAFGIGAIEQTVDDASYLVDDRVAVDRLAQEADSDEPVRGYCLVSISTHVGDADRDAVVAALAALLDAVAEVTGLEIVFLAHFGDLHGSSRGDSVIHDRIIDAMDAPARAIIPTNSVDAAQLARGAALGVSSRYHPVVFSVPAGVPMIAIPVDDYTRVKLSGALGNFGQDGVLTVSELLDGGGPVLVSRLWGDRDRIRAATRSITPSAQSATDAWWDRVADALTSR